MQERKRPEQRLEMELIGDIKLLGEEEGEDKEFGVNEWEQEQRKIETY